MSDYHNGSLAGWSAADAISVSMPTVTRDDRKRIVEAILDLKPENGNAQYDEGFNNAIKDKILLWRN